MKILSIGNSFSQDAQRYLKGVAKEVDPDIKNVNLYIGGCSFVRHYNNMRDDLAEYTLEIGGVSHERQVSIKEMLLSDDWDIVTLQEVSTRSNNVMNFEPYMSALAKYVRELCPNAKIALHETWGYESDTHRIKNQGYYKQGEMFAAIERAYTEAQSIINADYVIPSGKALQALADKGIAVHRDGAHASLGIGRYAIALTWLKTLYSVSVAENSFRDFDEPISDEDIATILSTVDSL